MRFVPCDLLRKLLHVCVIVISLPYFKSNTKIQKITFLKKVKTIFFNLTKNYGINNIGKKNTYIFYMQIKYHSCNFYNS